MLLPIIYRGAATAIVACAVAVVCHFALPLDARRRYRLTLAVAVGFIVGYALLPDWATFKPTRTWHWSPYLAIMAAIIGPAAVKLPLLERWLLVGVLFAIVALVLTPTWSSLAPPRSVYVPLLAAGLFLLYAAMEPLAKRAGKLLLVAMALASCCAAVTIAALVSITYGEITAAAAAAMCGACVFVVLARDGEDARGLTPLFLVLTGGMIFTAHVEPQVPVRSFLAIPAAPLALWLGSIAPLSRLSSHQKTGVQIAVLVAVLVVSALLASGLIGGRKNGAAQIWRNSFEARAAHPVH